jgi:RHS repeat-associated protein
MSGEAVTSTGKSFVAVTARGLHPIGRQVVLSGLLTIVVMLFPYAAGEALAVQATGASGSPALSATGRYVAFDSAASELVGGDTNGKQDVFVRDATNRVTERVSVSSSGAEANGDSSDPSLSDDGRYVTFTSLASNLVSNDTNGVADVFVFDRTTRVVERVTVSDQGAQLSTGGSDAAISGDGSSVAYVTRSQAAPSLATCRVPDNGIEDVYVYNRVLKMTTFQASAWFYADFAGACDGNADGDGSSVNPTISANGATVAFESDARNLEWNGGLIPPGGARAINDTNGVRDVYVVTRGVGSVHPASLADNGAQGNGASKNPSISDDGTRVAFESVASNLDQIQDCCALRDTDTQSDVFVRSVGAGATTTWISRRPAAGVPGGSFLPAISGDAKRVSFVTDAALKTKAVNQDTNGLRDVYQTTIALLGAVFGDGPYQPQPLSFDDEQGLANGPSSAPAESGDGTCTAFASSSTNLLPSFMADSNGVQDVYRHCFRPRLTDGCFVDRLSEPPPAHLPDDFYGADVDTIRPERLATCAGDPVNCATGNFFEQQVDFSIGGRGVGLELSRTYNAQDAASASAPRAFGYGWSSTFGERLAIDVPSGGVAVYHSDGQVARFTRRVDGSFAPERLVQSALRKNADGSYTYTLPDHRTFAFDTAGRLTSEADKNANKTTLGYDGSGRLTSITDPAGRRITLSYNTDGTVSQAKDPGGRQVLYGYDAAKNLIRVTDVGAKIWQFAYDTRHRMTSMTDPRAATTTNVYDSVDRVVSQTDPLGRRATWSYDGDETKLTDPLGNVTDELFRSNLPVIIKSALNTPSEAVTRLHYDADANLDRVTDPLNHVSTFGHDAQGNRTRVTDALGHSTSSVWDAQRNLTSLTRPSGRVTSYGYDARNNLTSVKRTLTETGQTQTTTNSYDGLGQLTSVTDPLNRVTRYGYDAQGDQTSATSPAGRTTSATYSTQGWLLTAVSGRGNIAGANPAAFRTTYTRDAYGRATTIRDPLGHLTTRGFDAVGHLIDTTDRDGRRTQYGFDLAGQPIQTTRGDASVLKTDYDATGQVIRQTDGLGNATSYARDPLGRVTSTTDPLGRATRYGYDTAGRRSTLTDPAGRITTFLYDNANRPTEIRYSTGQPMNAGYAYDVDDELVAMTDVTGRSTWAYDSLGRQTASTNGLGQTTGYGYDLGDQLTSLDYPSGRETTSVGGPAAALAGTVRRGYDADGNLTSVADWLGHSTAFAYDADANLATTTRPDASVSTLTTDANGVVTNLADLGPTTTLLRSSAPATAQGLLASLTESGTAAAPSETFGYDGAQRLTAAGSGAIRAYAYDAADNVTTLPVGAETHTQTFDVANELKKIANTSNAAVLGTLAYDADGNRTSNDENGVVSTYSYDQADRLIFYSGPNRASAGSTAATYYYDASGLRQFKNTGGRVSYEAYDRSGSLPLLIEDGLIAYVNGPDGRPIEQILLQGNTPRYLHYDTRGSIRALTNQSGAVLASYSYDAYGNRTSPATTVENPFGYNGQYTDPESGLQYLSARYYDPATGQFLTRDPIAGQTRAPYNYASNNPTNDNDPTGLFSLGDVTDAFGAGAKALGETAVGALDAPTFGLITYDLDRLGVHVNTCSGFYIGGGFLPIGGPLGIIGKGAKLAKAAEEAGTFYRLAAEGNEGEMALAKSGELAHIEGGQNFQGASPFASVDAYKGRLPKGAQGYEFTTPVKPSPRSPPGKARWIEGQPGVTSVPSGRVSIPCTVSRCQLP